MGNGNYHFRQLLVLFLLTPKRTPPPQYPHPCEKNIPTPKNRVWQGGGGGRAAGSTGSSEFLPRLPRSLRTPKPRAAPPNHPRSLCSPFPPYSRRLPLCSPPNSPSPPPQTPSVLFPPALRRFRPPSGPRAAPAPHRLPPPAAAGAPADPHPVPVPPLPPRPRRSGCLSRCPPSPRGRSPGPRRSLCPPPAQLQRPGAPPAPPARRPRRLPVLGAQRAKGSPAAERGLRLGRPRRIEGGLRGGFGAVFWGSGGPGVRP